MTPKLLIDTNIILDALLGREEAQEAIQLLALGAQRQVDLLVTPMSLGVVLWTLQKKRSARTAGPRLNMVKAMFHDLLACVDVIHTSKSNFIQSLNSDFLDLEDGAQYAAAISSGRLTAVVSRDQDYKGRTSVPLYTAARALKALAK